MNTLMILTPESSSRNRQRYGGRYRDEKEVTRNFSGNPVNDTVSSRAKGTDLETNWMYIVLNFMYVHVLYILKEALRYWEVSALSI